MANKDEKDPKDKDAKGKDQKNDHKKDKSNDDKYNEGGEQKPLSVKKIVIIMSAAFTLILLITVVALVLILQKDPTPPNPSTQSQEQTQDKKNNDNAKPAQQNQNKKEEKVEKAESKSSEGGHGEGKRGVIFYSIKPVFIVNLNSGRVKFLQIAVDVMTKDPDTITKLTDFLPIVKNELLILFSNKTYDEVKTIEGREALRHEALNTVRRVLEKEAGGSHIDDLLFTGFVVQ